MQQHNVILDCDNACGRFGRDIDDALALLYLLGRDDVKLIGVTNVFGNTGIDQVGRCTKKLLKRLGHTHVPVLRGAAAAGDRGTDAARFLADSATRYRGNLTVVATGPLTNLAAAADLDGEFFNNLKAVTCMGGYREPVRIGLRAAGELNISADPQAAARVFSQASPVTLFTTEICLQASLGVLDLWRLSYLHWRVRLHMAQWLAAYGLSRGISRFFLWDVLPAVAVTHPHMFDRSAHQRPSDTAELRHGYIADRAGTGIEMPRRIIDRSRFSSVVEAAWAQAAPATPQLEVDNEIDVGAPIEDVFAIGERGLVADTGDQVVG